MNTLSWIVDGSFSTRLTVALLHFLWQGCIGGMLVILGGWLLRGAAARSRYSLNVAAMLLMAACLPVTFILLDRSDAVADRPASVQNTHESLASPLSRAERLDPAKEQALPDGPELISRDAPSVGPNPAAETGRESTEAGSTRVSPAMWLPSISSLLTANAFPTLSRWVAALYLIGVALILGRLLRGVWGGHRLRKMAKVVQDPLLLEMVRKLARRLGLKIVPAIAWCEQISIPVVVGIVTPMILLPMSVVSGLTPSQLQALMLHELSHIRRFDPVVNLLQRIIEAMLFFHPVVWFVSRRISIEREHVADDMVLAAGWDRPLYADALVRVAELASSISGPDVARRATVIGAAGTNPSEFKLRVLRLLEDSHPPKLDLSRAVILATLLFVVIGGVFAWSQTDKPETTRIQQSRSENAGAAAIDRHEPQREAAVPPALRYSEATEVILSMNSLKFMLDLDSGQTMDPPATANRPEQKKMDIYPIQYQPYDIPPGLIGVSLRGIKTKPKDWNVSVDELQKELASDRVGVLTKLPYAPDETATYFFRTAAGTGGVLQLLAQSDEPKGIRVRYKTLVATNSGGPSLEVRTLRKPALLLPDHWIVTSVGFDNDGKELVTASAQSFVTIRRWDVVGKKLISEIKLEGDQHGRQFREGTLMLSGDRRRVIAATDAYVGIWETATGKLLTKLSIPKIENNDTVRILSCTPDFSVIVGSLETNYSRTTLRYDAHTVVWDGTIGKMLRTLTHKAQNDLIAISLSPNGKRFVTTNGGGANVWDTSTGQQLLHVPNDNAGRKHSDPDVSSLYTNHVWSVQFSPSGKQLAIGDILGLKLVDAQSGKLLQQFDGPYRYSSSSSPNLVFSKDGQRLARLGTRGEAVENKADYVVPIWSTQTGQKLFELHTDANSGAFSDDGQRLAVGFSDMQMGLAIWQLSGRADDLEQPDRPGPESRQDKVEENGHYRGQKAAEFIDTFQPTWGEAKLGIQYGVALTKPQRQFRIGERVPLVVFFRNASDKPLKIDMRPDFFGNTPKVLDAQGAVVEIENVPLLGSIPHYVEKLEPGEAVGPFYLNFGLGENPRPGKQNWHPYYKTPVAGQYRVTHSVSIDVADLKDGDQSKRAQITTGQVEFEIINGPDKTEARPASLKPQPTIEPPPKPSDQPAVKKTAKNQPIPSMEDNPTLEKGLQVFQGTWNFDACESVLWDTPLNEIRASWKWAIEGREMTWTRAGKDPVRMSIKVDPTKKPNQIDFTFLDGPDKGTTCQGIYEFERMNLWICMTEPGANVPRPDEMAMSSTSQTALIILNRARKNWIVSVEKADEAAPKPVLAAADQSSLLQGAFHVERWTSERWPAKPDELPQWQWIVQGQEVTWTRPGQETVRLSFTIDASKPLPEIDLTFLDGPHKGEKCRGVYLASRHEVAICFQDPGANVERPKYLGSKPGSHHTAITLAPTRIPPVAEEIEALSGPWKFDIYYSDWWPARISNPPFSKKAWRWSIKGNEIAWTGMKIDDVRLSYTLDPSKSPKQIDLTFLDGPYKGEKLRGIYKFGFGNSCDICVADPGSNADRPASFGYSTNSGHTWISLERVPGK